MSKNKYTTQIPLRSRKQFSKSIATQWGKKEWNQQKNGTFRWLWGSYGQKFWPRKGNFVEHAKLLLYMTTSEPCTLANEWKSENIAFCWRNLRVMLVRQCGRKTYEYGIRRRRLGVSYVMDSAAISARSHTPHNRQNSCEWNSWQPIIVRIIDIWQQWRERERDEKAISSGYASQNDECEQ